MTTNNRSMLAHSSIWILFVATGILMAPPAMADSANGTLSYQSKSGPLQVSVTNVYLVQGPDSFSGKPIRKLIFSATDISGKIKTCATMSCPDGELGAGMTIELSPDSRLNYWFVGNDQRVQYSGGARREALILTTDSPQRVSGKLAIDDSASGGIKANVTFDATLAKQYSDR